MSDYTVLLDNRERPGETSCRRGHRGLDCQTLRFVAGRIALFANILNTVGKHGATCQIRIGRPGVDGLFYSII